MLGRGGMGIVFRAMHLQLEQHVAIKFLLPEVKNVRVVQRFMREAQSAVRLRSEHVARVIDVGALDTGAPYIVLEYLEGADLKSFAWEPLGIGGLIDLLLQACEALTEAHALGIVHRDIKPANLFITSSLGGVPVLKLLDFGVSKAWPTSDLTASHTTLGTPPYMAPEQMRSSRGADHRSDIWSLGVVLYELLQGAKPFDSDTLPPLILAVVNDPPPRLTAAMPAGLDAVIYRCLEKDPARRFQSIAELAVALAPYAQSPAQVAITLQRTRTTGSQPLEALPAPGRGPPSGAASDARALIRAAGAGASAPSTISTSDSVFSVSVTTAPRARRWPVVAVLGALAGIGVAIGAFAGGGTGDAGSAPRSGSAATANTVTPDVGSSAIKLEELPTAPAPGDNLDRAAPSAPPVVDGGMVDAAVPAPSNTPAVLSLQPPKTRDKNAPAVPPPKPPRPKGKSSPPGGTEGKNATPQEELQRLRGDY
jgi:serine/threonine-protein kinase